MQFQVDWDKVEGKNGDSYLHIPHLLKNLLDLYERKKAIVFKDRKPSHVTRDDWLDHEDTPFFLTSGGHAFSKIDLYATSEAMGTPINARDVRKIVSTWAQSHRQEDIRRSEEYALNHGQRVAQDRYLVINNFQLNFSPNSWFLMKDCCHLTWRLLFHHMELLMQKKLP